MPRPETLTRYLLIREDGEYVERMNVLLDSASLQKGSRVTLEEFPDQIWEVVTKEETLDRASIKRGWNNNI
jgi:hypothetical protein